MSSGGPPRTPEDMRGHTIKTVRDREDEGSNPSPPTIFVFKIGDFRITPECAARSRITISYGATKPRLVIGVDLMQFEIVGQRPLANQRPEPADARNTTVRLPSRQPNLGESCKAEPPS